VSLEQVQAWIADQQRALDETGIRNLQLAILSSGVQVSGWDNWRYEIGAGNSIPAAYAQLRSKIPMPLELAARKREQAKELLREANELEAQHDL
jgi:hypothetical protein